MTHRTPQTAAIVFRYVPQYRAPFYEGLRAELAARGICLRLIYGDPTRRHDVTKHDAVGIPWGHRIHNRVVSMFGTDLFWQPCLHLLRDVDLVIVEQANKLLLNYVLGGWRLAGGRRLAYWGHGADLQRLDVKVPATYLKEVMSRNVDWWFAYTDSTRRRLQGLGYPDHRITVVNNAIDTRALREWRSDLAERDSAGLRTELGLGSGPIGLFLGAVYASRRIPWLLDACRRVRAELPDFEMLFVGGGADSERLAAAARGLPWIRVAGPRYGRDKVKWAMAADVMLMPFGVGLSVLDSFALEVPLVTTDAQGHGPEIDYVVDGENAVVLAGTCSSEAYGGRVVDLLRDRRQLERLRAGCTAAASMYTIQHMAERFADGVSSVLEAP